MKQLSLLTAVILAVGLGLSFSAGAMPKTEEKNVKEGVVKAWRLGKSNYCHLKFPPIKISTLLSGKPQLMDPETTTLIDYYGPCSHDPLGEVEVERQQDMLQRRMSGE